MAWSTSPAQNIKKMSKSAKMDLQRDPRAPHDCQSCSQGTPRCPKGPPKTSQGTPKSSQGSPKAPKKTPKRHPRVTTKRNQNTNPHLTPYFSRNVSKTHACAVGLASKKTCLSKGTGSAFQWGEFVKHGLNTFRRDSPKIP